MIANCKSKLKWKQHVKDIKDVINDSYGFVMLS